MRIEIFEFIVIFIFHPMGSLPRGALCPTKPTD